MLRIWMIGLLVLSAGCQKEKREPAQSKVASAAERGDVVATLQLPAGDNMVQLAPMMDKVQPGSAAMVGAQIPMLLAKACGVDLSAADLSKPVSLVVLNPKKFADPMAVLVRVEDLNKLKAATAAAQRAFVHRDGLALIGAADVVQSAQHYAFGVLAVPSKQAVGLAFPIALNAIYKDEITDAIANMARAMESLGSQGNSMVVLMQLYQKALGSVAEQSDRIEVSVDAQGQVPSLLAKVYPIEGSTMASFVAAQAPSQHELLNKLPASSSDSIVFSGLLRAGAARKAIVDFGVEAMKTMYNSEALGKMAEQMGPWFDSFDGRVAMTMSMTLDPSRVGTGPEMHYLLGSTDAKAMRKGWHEMFDLLAKQSEDGSSLSLMGIKSRVEINKNVLQVDGVEVDHYHSQFDVESMPAAQREAFENMGAADQNMYFASFDQYAAMASDQDGKSSIASMVRAARGKEAGFQTPANLKAVLNASKARKESLVMYMNVKSLAPGGGAMPIPFQSIIMGLGKDKDALVMRVSIGL